MKKLAIATLVCASFLLGSSSYATADCRCDRLEQRQEKLELRLDSIALQRDYVLANNPIEEGQWILPLPALERLWQLETRRVGVVKRLTEVNRRLAQFC